jgi:hypothetical protein
VEDLMNSFSKLRKSITWYYLVSLLCLFISWISGDFQRSWQWLVIGAVVGLVLEAVSTFFWSKRKKVSLVIELIILSSCALLGFFSIILKWLNMSALLRATALGLVLAATLVQVGVQLYERRLITFEEIRENPQ